MISTIIICGLLIAVVSIVSEIRITKKDLIIAKKEKSIADFAKAGNTLLDCYVEITDDYKCLISILEDHFEPDEISKLFQEKKEEYREED